MTVVQMFDEDPRREDSADAQLLLDLDGYDGPIDLLLTLAREQKVDLAKISILQLAEQYLAFIEHARRLRLEIAADYLVMAAWLAYLKSRLLLPEPETEEDRSGQDLAQALAFQLRRLEAMQQVGAQLMAGPRLGRDVLARGAPDPILPLPKAGAGKLPAEVTLYDLLAAYAAADARHERPVYDIPAFQLFAVEDALERLTTMLGRIPGWSALGNFLPGPEDDLLVNRSAVAATFGASLELAKRGAIELRQDGAFSPIFLRRKLPQA